MNEPTPMPSTPDRMATHAGSGGVHAAATNAGPRYGRFALGRFHAKGGLGEVHVAVDEELKRAVALKRMQERCASDPAARRRFLNEAEITAKLEHPGVVPIYGLVQDEHGQPCYAMRFIEGESLAEAIKRFHGQKQSADCADSTDSNLRNLRNLRMDYSSLAFRQLLQRFISVCNTIAFAHSKNVIHRDIKPGNVMLGPFGETLVVDWGLARELASRDREGAVEPAEEEIVPTTINFTPSGSDEHVYTQAGQALGTLGYMAPEQAAGRWNVVGSCSDIFSLGATLYEMLTGVRPIRGQDQQEAMQNAQAGDFPAPRTGKRDVPKALEAICLKAMARKPEERYVTAKDLAADLEHWLADEPVSAYAEAWPATAGRWLRKHKANTATAAAVLLTAILGLSVGLYFVSAEKNRTELARQGEERQRIAAQQSEEAAKNSEEKAKTEAATATAVKDFLQRDLLKLASARQQYGEERRGVLKTDPDLRVRDLVLRAAQKIEGKFADQPLVEAEIRWTLGWTLDEIGRAELAIPQFLRARELCTANLGRDHPSTLRSMMGLAASYSANGRTQEAMRLREETLQLQKAKLGADHRDTLQSMNNLAGSYADAGRTQEAMRLREETLELRKAKLGADHPDTLFSMNSLAGSYAEAGRTQEALRLREETLQLRKAKLGPDHPDTLKSMNNLANSYIAADRPGDAMALLNETLQHRQRRLESQPGNTLEQSYLAWTHGQIGEAEQARFNFAAAVAAFKRSLELFTQLDQAGALKEPFFRERMNFYRRQLTLCGKAEQAVKDLDFALAQPAEHVGPLLDLRLRYLLKEKQLDAAVATAAKMKERAGDDAGRLYDAACEYALCAAAAKSPSPPTPLPKGARGEELAEEAMALLKQAVAKGYKDAGHMRADGDLAALREREDFKKLLADLTQP